MAASKKKYYTVAKVLHWTAGFIIAFNLLSGWRLKDFPVQKEVLVMIHSGIGLTIALFMLFRWYYRRKHNLYVPPGWQKRPSMVLQWIFYPLVLIQVVIGVAHAAFIDYDVRAFGFINISALADANAELHAMLLDVHGWMAISLIVLVLVHGVERSRKAFGG